MKSAKKLSKTKLIVLIALIAITIISFSFIALNLIFKSPSSKWYSASEQAFKLPTDDRAFNPSAICYDNSAKTYLVAGSVNAKGDQARGTPIYVVDAESGQITKTVYVQNQDRQIYTGKITDIAIYDSNFIYLANGTDTLFAYSYNSFKQAQNESTVSLKGTYTFHHSDSDYLNVEFLSIYGGRLYVGERADTTNPISSHNIEDNGKTNSALILTYYLSYTYAVGISPTPFQAYSVPAHVTDFIVNDSKMYVICSDGLGSSTIYEHNRQNVLSSSTFSVLSDEANVSLYILGQKNLHKTYTAPMGLSSACLVDNLLYSVFEKPGSLFDSYSEYKFCYRTDIITLRNLQK